jgi:enoyl-[acyl-carrier protein] reductase III
MAESAKMADGTARPLAGKVAFVTGGSGGIGRAMCVRFASLGAKVGFSYFSDHDKADESAAAVRAAGGTDAVVIRGNLRDAEGTEALATAILAAFPRVDIFVSNAASGVLKPALELTAKHWDWTMSVNARAFLLLAGKIAPTMERGGRILALSSAGSIRAIPLYASIGASKAALEATVRHLAMELAPRGITVNAISPGIVETGALDHFPHKDDLIKLALMKTPAGRLTTVEDVADVAELLVSPKAQMIQGQTIVVDGGYTMMG